MRKVSFGVKFFTPSPIVYPGMPKILHKNFSEIALGVAVAGSRQRRSRAPLTGTGVVYPRPSRVEPSPHNYAPLPKSASRCKVLCALKASAVFKTFTS